MIDSQRGALRRVVCNHLISNNSERNNCFIKKIKTFCLILLISLCKKDLKHNLMVAIFRAWYDGSYAMLVA